MCVFDTAVHFEQGHYDECIKECEEAVEIGREHRADFKLIAKLAAILPYSVSVVPATEFSSKCLIEKYRRQQKAANVLRC